MYFWNINKLKQQLIETGLTEKQLFYYILIFITVISTGSEISKTVPYEDSEFWRQCEAAFVIFITIIGTIAAFYANGGDSGTKFAERYFSIGFVISIRFIIFLIPIISMISVIIAVYYLNYYSLQYGWSKPNGTDFFLNYVNVIEFVFTVIWETFSYIRIVKHIGDVAKAKSDKLD